MRRQPGHQSGHQFVAPGTPKAAGFFECQANAPDHVGVGPAVRQGVSLFSPQDFLPGKVVFGKNHGKGCIIMITVRKVGDAVTRAQALKVVEGVYWQEKNWIKSVGQEIPAEIAADRRTSWFLASANDDPAGVLRLFYDP